MNKTCDAPDCDNPVNPLLPNYCSTTCENVNLEIKGEQAFGSSEGLLAEVSDERIEEIREKHEVAQKHIDERIEQSGADE